jgi:hypothetical protein
MNKKVNLLKTANGSSVLKVYKYKGINISI